MSLFAVFSILAGLALFAAGTRRLADARVQGTVMILFGVLLNTWWIALLVMVLYKTTVLKQDT